MEDGLLVEDRRAFLAFRGSRAGLFSNLSAEESCPLRVPLAKLMAAVSPADKLRKDSALPPVTSEKPSCPPESAGNGITSYLPPVSSKRYGARSGS